MGLRVVGAGFGRTGTLSLKTALEQLLGAPCYHMFEVVERPEHVAAWTDASLGTLPDWDSLFHGYAAAVDWPASAFWPELMEAFPDAVVLLSVRDADAWWRSASRTIFPATRASEEGPFRSMIEALWGHRFTNDTGNEERCKRLFLENIDRVRREVPPERLVEWRPGDGWEPICSALGLTVPGTAFPHTNTTAEFNATRAPGATKEAS